MALNILGVTIPENLDSFKVTENGMEKDIEEVIVYGVSRWKKQKYYWIAFYANGGSGNMSTQTMPVGIATALSPNAFGRAGYLFDGWSVNGVNKTYGDAQVVTDIATAGQTLPLYALWKGITYYIDYLGNGATEGETARSTHTYDVSSALSPNGYARTGYLFNGWQAQNGTVYGNQQAVINLSAANGSVIGLNARWAPVTYYVQYNGNGADNGSMANTTHTYDVPAALASNAYKKSYCSFLGWATEGSGVKYADKAFVKNLTASDKATVSLNAVWKPGAIINYTDRCTSISGNIYGVFSYWPDGNADCYWDSQEKVGCGYITDWPQGRGGYMWMSTNNMIDLTHVNKIKAQFSGFATTFNFGVGKLKDSVSYTKNVHSDYLSYHGSGPFNYELDVSDLTGLYYIKTSFYSGMHDGYASSFWWHYCICE